MSKESFKLFARKHPELAETIMNNSTSWQKLYEIYEIYGEDSSIWNDLITKQSPQTLSSFKDLFQTFKNIDIDSVQKGVTNLQKTLGLLQELGIGNKEKNRLSYDPKPIYKYFED